MAKLARFVNEETDKEFVVIFSEDDPDYAAFLSDGYGMREAVTIIGDVTTFPCETELTDPNAA